jgi:hypothetical protein
MNDLIDALPHVSHTGPETVSETIRRDRLIANLNGFEAC